MSNKVRATTIIPQELSKLSVVVDSVTKFFHDKIGYQTSPKLALLPTTSSGLPSARRVAQELPVV